MAKRRGAAKPYQLELSNRVVATVPDDFCSLTIDTSLVLGGHWWSGSPRRVIGLSPDITDPLDLAHPDLLYFASALAPAMLRIGGTEADQVWYRLSKKTDRALEGEAESVESRQTTHEFVLKKGLWKRINRFAQDAGFSLLFTLSAGPSDRDLVGAWVEESARALLAWSTKKELSVAAWELGNEVNGFPFIHGLRHRVSAKQYTADFARFARLVRSISPQAKTVGPASAVWPIIGEPNAIIPTLSRHLQPGLLDALSWHYYPQQSRRGKFATRRATKYGLVSAKALDGVDRWVRHVVRARDRFSPRRPEIWMTETGHALYGGEPGLSDRFLSVLWWMDELSLLANRGLTRVFRQALIGADYGLLDQSSFEPRPDFWATFLWKKLVGPAVYEQPGISGPNKRLRAWLHAAATNPNRRCLVLVNLNRQTSIQVTWPGRLNRLFRLEGADGPESRTLLINGVRPDRELIDGWDSARCQQRYAAPELTTAGPEPTSTINLRLAPLSCALVEFGLD